MKSPQDWLPDFPEEHLVINGKPQIDVVKEI